MPPTVGSALTKIQESYETVIQSLYESFSQQNELLSSELEAQGELSAGIEKEFQEYQIQLRASHEEVSKA